MMHPDTTAGATAPAKWTRKSPKDGTRKSDIDKTKGVKESRAEQVIHEMMRLAHVDLRASEHGKGLARELASLIGGK